MHDSPSPPPPLSTTQRLAMTCLFLSATRVMIHISVATDSAKQWGIIKLMGGIVTRESGSGKTSPSHAHATLGRLDSHQNPSIPISRSPTTENYIPQFFLENRKVLSSHICKKEDPHLVMLRMILGCDYGRPKLIRYLLRTTPILDFLSGKNWFQEVEGDSFVVEDFISKFNIVSSHMGTFGNKSFEAVPVPVTDINSFCHSCILITAVSSYQNFLKSQEHADWLKYQQMIDSTLYSNSVNFVQSPVAGDSAHRIAIEILNSGYQESLKKSYWIVALACLLDQIPFPVSILGERTNSEPPKTKSLFSHLSSVENGSVSATPTPMTTMIFFGNNAFVEMAGDTREEIARNPFDKYCSAPDGPPPDNPPPSIDFATPSRVAVMFYPRPPLKPFLDLQSRLPLRDPEGDCPYVLVMHCDIGRFRENSEYLQMLGRLTDILSQAVIPQREHSSTFLRAYFYHQEELPHPPTRTVST
jgi:hypothetical protein